MIKLQYLEKEDLRKIVEWNSDKSADYLLQWSGPTYSYPLTIKQVEDYFISNNSNTSVYKILSVDTDEFIGTIELRETDKSNKIGRVCRFLIGEENYRGKRIGTHVLKEVLRIGFKDFKFDKITLGVFDFNYGAIKCYEKAGFVKEKFIENSRKSSTGYWNLYEMSISKIEWQIRNQ